MPSESFDQLPVTQAESQTSPQSTSCCCGMSGNWMTMLLGATTLLAIGAAAYFAGQASTAVNSQAASLQQVASQDFAAPEFKLPLIDATAAVSSEKFSMATGMVSDRAEGVFVLDHNSGLLQCAVMYPRLGKFMSVFTTNVGEALETGGKGGRYIMVTGVADFPSSSNRPAAGSVIYVLDTATGVYACYGIPFDRVAMNANRPQQGALVLIAKGTANPIQDRDGGR